MTTDNWKEEIFAHLFQAVNALVILACDFFKHQLESLVWEIYYASHVLLKEKTVIKHKDVSFKGILLLWNLT